MHSLIALFLAAVLVGCTTVPANRSAYNLGVDAFRARDFASARVHWAKSVEEGDSSAENNLGYLLFHALGGPPEAARAVTLWRKAALTGHPESQLHLGSAYEGGKGIAQSSVEAYAWYRCSIAGAEAAEGRGMEVGKEIAVDARKSLAKLLPSLSKEDFEAGEQLAKRYIEKHAARPSKT